MYKYVLYIFKMGPLWFYILTSNIKYANSNCYILATQNDDTNAINNLAFDQCPGVAKVYISFNNVIKYHDIKSMHKVTREIVTKSIL